jgi:hypothetical protein
MEVFMQIVILVLAFCLYISTAFAGDVQVDGYYRKDGTYVQPHYRSAPDENPNNNWSTKGNINPYTGQEGTHQPNDGYGSGYGSAPNDGYGATPSNPYGN